MKNGIPPVSAAETNTLSFAAALKICAKHCFRQAAERQVDLLLYRDKLDPKGVARLVQEQMSEYALVLVKAVEQSHPAMAKTETLPARTQQRAALREISGALKVLHGVITRDWDMVRPFLEIETTEYIGGLLSTEGASKLLPPSRRSEFVRQTSNKDQYNQHRLKLSHLLSAGSGPMTILISAAIKGLRRAESRISSGRLVKAPHEILFIAQLADYFELALEKKASATIGGPFYKFASDVVDEVGLVLAHKMDHLVRESLKHHRRSFVARRRHERDTEAEGAEGRSTKRRPRKQKLATSSKRKIAQKQ